MAKAAKVKFFSYGVGTTMLGNRQGKLDELSGEVNEFLSHIDPENVINVELVHITNTPTIVVMVAYKE